MRSNAAFDVIHHLAVRRLRCGCAGAVIHFTLIVFVQSPSGCPPTPRVGHYPAGCRRDVTFEYHNTRINGDRCRSRKNRIESPPVVWRVYNPGAVDVPISCRILAQGTINYRL